MQAGKSNTTMLAFLEHLKCGMRRLRGVVFTARVCVAGESEHKVTSAVMNSTYVRFYCGGGGGGSKTDMRWPLDAQYSHLSLL